jgi:hypothetical protein
MKTFKKIIFLSLTILLSFTLNAQDYVMSSVTNPLENTSVSLDTSDVTPLIENEVFTYKSHGEEVLVVFSETEHIEYYNDKKHYIKSKISWLSTNECLMTIVDSDLPNFPFRNGTKLSMVITKVKGKNVHYKSTLGGRTWSGKMKKQ